MVNNNRTISSMSFSMLCVNMSRVRLKEFHFFCSCVVVNRR